MLQSAVVLSLDSLVAGAALGALLPARAARLRLALMFGICDGLAGWAAWGLALAPPDWLAPAAPFGIALYGLYLLIVGRSAAGRPQLVGLVPLLLALDNLMSPTPPSAALLCGAASALFAAAGLAIGHRIGGRRGWTAPGAVFAAALLAAL